MSSLYVRCIIMNIIESMVLTYLKGIVLNYTSWRPLNEYSDVRVSSSVRYGELK